MQLVEAARAAEHLAHDQNRPTVAEGLGGLGDRAVLRVAGHRATMLAAHPPTGLQLEPVGSKVELVSPAEARLRCSHEPHRTGSVYVNFLDSDDDSSRVREAYGEQIYRRLAEVKAKYDPDNAFHHNKNIQPADARTAPTGPKGFQEFDSHRRPA